MKNKILNHEEIKKYLKDNNVAYIRMQFTDLLGNVKAVEIPFSKIDDALNNQIMFDGSSIEGFARIEESDMYLYPDYDTFEIFPWRPQQGKVARLICDVYTTEGKPFEGDPRNVLKNTYTELNSTYNIYLYKLNDTAFELEDNTIYSPLNAEVMYYTYQISKDNQLYDAINIYIALK